MKCKTCGHETKAELIFEMEGMTITTPQVAKTYQDAKNLCPKGYRLPTRWELCRIFEKMENRKKLSDGSYIFFWSSLIEDKYVRGLCLDRDLDVFSYYDGLTNSDDGGLDGSNDNGRVVFVKEMK